MLLRWLINWQKHYLSWYLEVGHLWLTWCKYASHDTTENTHEHNLDKMSIISDSGLESTSLVKCSPELHTWETKICSEYKTETIVLTAIYLSHICVYIHLASTVKWNFGIHTSGTPGLQQQRRPIHDPLMNLNKYASGHEWVHFLTHKCIS